MKKNETDIGSIQLEDWDRKSQAKKKAKPLSKQEAETQMLSNILLSKTPGSLDELDRYLADNKQKLHNAYVSTSSYQMKAFFENIVKAFNALFYKRNELFPEHSIEGDIELQTFKNETLIHDDLLPQADHVTEANRFRPRDLENQDDSPIYPTTARYLTENQQSKGMAQVTSVAENEKYKQFASIVPSHEEADKIATMQPLFENFKKTVSTALVALTGFIAQNFKSRNVEIQSPIQKAEEIKEGTYAHTKKR